MRNIIFILLSSICILSCSTKDFTINGTVENKDLNGSTIFIKERINRIWTTIDSTVIKDKQFQFTGIADTAKIVYLTYELPTDNTIRQAFILENGEIIAKLDSTEFMSITGTAQNNLLQNYQNEKNIIYQQQEKKYAAFKADEFTEEKEEQLNIEMQKLDVKNKLIDKKYSTDNINTLVGNYIFMSSFYEMTTAEKEEIVAKMSYVTKNINRISEIIADIAIEKKVAVGEQYIDFKLATISGDSLSLSDLVGKSDYIMIDFWASWCGPCMRSLPELKTVYNKYNRSHFEILGVSLDNDFAIWEETVKTHQLLWKHISDLKGWKCEGSRLYAINSIPSTILIDKAGKIIAKNMSILEIDKILTGKDLKK